jgi:hypothetical protein
LMQKGKHVAIQGSVRIGRALTLELGIVLISLSYKSILSAVSCFFAVLMQSSGINR